MIMSKIMSKIGIGIDSERQIAPQTVAKAPQLPETPESGCDFVLHDADGQLVMRNGCPEIRGRKAECGKLKVEIEMNAEEERRRKGGGGREARSRRSRCIGTAVQALAELRSASGRTNILGEIAGG
jgi:hypothetical protein